MLWALGQPAALVGLLLAYFGGLILRRTVHYFAEPRGVYGASWVEPRRDVDPFGAVAAAVGGVGWGRAPSERCRIWGVVAAPLVIIAISIGVLGVYQALGYSSVPLELDSGSDVLHGAPGEPVEQCVLAFGVGLLAFGLVALIPIPPLDGWRILTALNKRPSLGFQKADYWLGEQNLGIAILLACLLLPIFRGLPVLLALLDLVITPVLRAWV
ncbi:MAG: hypothetical protein HOQ05_00335 [Corynebacteriales bacterium]|nr:hypothetical protein [Mycobacteriales bacterium]